MRSSLHHARRRRTMPAPRGLTIVELIVTIGVIALLMAIVFPALGSVMSRSRAFGCASNLRQLGTAHQMYMNINRDAFAPAGLSHGGSPGNPRNSWLTKVPTYLDGFSALRSPVDLSPYWSVDEGGDHDGMTLKQAIAHLESSAAATLPDNLIARWSSYGLNIMLTDAFSGFPNPATGEEMKWLRLHSVPRPSMTVHFLMLTDGTGLGDPAFARTDHADTDGWVNLPGSQEVVNLEHVAKQMQMHAHRGRPATWSAVANYGFLDGSVEALAFSAVYENKHRNRFLPIATMPN